MTIIDHGVFTQYIPVLSADDPLKQMDVLFCQNAAGVDWYSLQAWIEPGAALVEVDATTGEVIGKTGEAGSHDYSTRWPLDRRLLEVRPAEDAEDITIGMVYRDGVIIAPPVPVPDEVTNFQARAALMRVGLFDAIDAFVKLADDDDPAALMARQAWEYSNHFYRHGDLIQTLAPHFGLSEDALDALFIAAAAIDA